MKYIKLKQVIIKANKKKFACKDCKGKGRRQELKLAYDGKPTGEMETVKCYDCKGIGLIMKKNIGLADVLIAINKKYKYIGECFVSDTGEFCFLIAENIEEIERSKIFWNLIKSFNRQNKKTLDFLTGFLVE